ncbi:kinase-like domain-containing protein [Flagelloscypha sp. PMI_526]|nr:kinase-like domain-containing protein [Flagelloscypha sp. PMI_526]
MALPPGGDLEVSHPLRKLAKYTSTSTPSFPTEPPSTKASAPVRDDDVDAAAAEVFEFSKAESSTLNADGLGAANYHGSADRLEEAKRALLHLITARVFVAVAGIFLPDAAPKREVAIKSMPSQVTMYKSGQREAALLAKLNAADPNRHVVRSERTFEWRGHFCIVMEGLGWNLRDFEVVWGGSWTDYCCCQRHMLFKFSCPFLLSKALSLFKKASITHTDIQPDDILMWNNTTLKARDLGSAAGTPYTESTPTPYLVYRFYRAPQTILGLPHDSSLDTWSAKLV